MCLDGVGDHHLFEGRALLADLELRVTVRPLEVQMRCVVERFYFRVVGADLFGQQQDRPPSLKPVLMAPKHLGTRLGRQELQDPVHGHGTGILDGKRAHIRFDEGDPRIRHRRSRLLEHGG